MTFLATTAVLLLLGAPRAPASTSTPTTDERARVTTSKEDESKILTAYRAMNRAMVDGDTDRLSALMHDDASLTHITGYVQPKREWLTSIESGEMRYHEMKERSDTSR